MNKCKYANDFTEAEFMAQARMRYKQIVEEGKKICTWGVTPPIFACEYCGEDIKRKSLNVV